jgi:ribosomal protein S27E
VSLNFGPCHPTEVDSGAATCSMALGSASLRGSTDAATCPTAPSDMCITGIKKCLAALGTQLGPCVTKVCSHVTEAPARYAHMLPRRLQDVRTDDIIITCKTCGHAATVWLNSATPHSCPLTGTVSRGCDPIGRDVSHRHH